HVVHGKRLPTGWPTPTTRDGFSPVGPRGPRQTAPDSCPTPTTRDGFQPGWPTWSTPNGSDRLAHAHHPGRRQPRWATWSRANGSRQASPRRPPGTAFSPVGPRGPRQTAPDRLAHADHPGRLSARLAHVV